MSVPSCTSLRRALLGATTTAALLAGGLVTAPPATAADPHPRAVAAADWLADELGRQNPWQQSGFASWGPTLDALFSLKKLGVRRGVRQDVLDVLEPRVEEYVGGGPESYAGPTGKLLTAVLAQRNDPATYAGGGLVSRLEDRIDTTGPDTGRARDASEFGEFSTTIGQSFVVRALARLDHQRADETVSFLLKQQCAEGYFREDLDSADFTCDGGTAEQSAPDVDSTAYAVLALSAARRAGVEVDPLVLETAIEAAGEWLADVQRDSGGFRGVGGVSANSTGLAALAFVAADRRGRADRAAEWVAARQVTARMARRTELDRRDVGAIAPTRQALREARREGVERAERITWRLATAQAAAALDALRRG